MESLDLTDDELRAEYKRALKMRTFLEARGEVAASHYTAVARSLAAEIEVRGL